MNYEATPWAVVLFISFVAVVLGISYHFARKTKSASGYFAAGGNIHWSVNGIAFAGDYLSAASFLGICGMLAMSGYDGFLYSIGYLAGWIVALFVVAEPLKRLGKYTFTDALDAKFHSKGIQLTAAISTLLVSLFYLIPQMVGAGTLVTPLLGLPHWAGVLMVGVIVIIIVSTAGMQSTTYVQFFKGGLLIIFSLVLVFLVFSRGISTAPDQGGDVTFHEPASIKAVSLAQNSIVLEDTSYTVISELANPKAPVRFVRLKKDGAESIWSINDKENILQETQYTITKSDGEVVKHYFQSGNMVEIDGKTNTRTGTLNIFTFIDTIRDGKVLQWPATALKDGEDIIHVNYQSTTLGKDILKPGLKFKVDSEKGATPADKADFISLMLALFLGTAALPHILIRYYTVATPADARKSTIVAIAAIGLFYILTMYMGLGAMVSGVLDVTNSNMSAPLLAKSFGVMIFAIISALAFATVLGTVSGLIVAASGAIAHDIMDRFMGMKLGDDKKVRAGKIASIFVGCIAMVLGVMFKNMNVSFLVGWAFAIAASANLPAIIMILFWNKTTAKGVIASIATGLLVALGMVLFSQEAYNNVYGLVGVTAPIPFNNPAIISVPLSFLTLVVVSLMTQNTVGKKA
ncbi:cation acetate symporter [Bacillota bacterium]